MKDNMYGYAYYAPIYLYDKYNLYGFSNAMPYFWCYSERGLAEESADFYALYNKANMFWWTWRMNGGVNYQEGFEKFMSEV